MITECSGWIVWSEQHQVKAQIHIATIDGTDSTAPGNLDITAVSTTHPTVDLVLDEVLVTIGLVSAWAKVTQATYTSISATFRLRPTEDWARVFKEATEGEHAPKALSARKNPVVQAAEDAMVPFMGPSSAGDAAPPALVAAFRERSAFAYDRAGIAEKTVDQFRWRLVAEQMERWADEIAATNKENAA